MNDTAPVSVVIPTYNGKLFLKEAVDSVKAQTLPVAEIIVVDDGSTDGTLELAHSLDVTVLSQQHAGITAARNTGILKSTQPWIAFLDHDDLWEAEKIEAQMNIAARDPGISMITCDYSIFDRNGTTESSILEKYRRGYAGQPKTRLGENEAVIYELNECFADAIYILMPSFLMMKHELLQQIGMFDESLGFAEDFDCFMRGLVSSSLGVVEKILGHRRVHESNASHRYAANTLTALRVTEQVMEHPQLYPPATVKLCTKWLPSNLRHAAARLLWTGDARAARKLLLRSARLQFSLRTLLALAASATPSGIGRNLMSARYYVSKTFGI